MTSPPDYNDYLSQLTRLPGGPAAALRDFLAPWLGEAPSAPVDACWSLREGGRLCLRLLDAHRHVLVHETPTAQVEITRFDEAFATACQRAVERGIPPLVLALLAIAAGDVDDGRRLKGRLPGLDRAARDLMLMTLCRLCG